MSRIGLVVRCCGGLLDVRHIFTAPYFPLSQFLIPVLTRYKAVFFWYLTQKHHLDAKHLGQLVVANMDHCLEA